MLLAAALVAPVLGRDIYDVDEAATMLSACAGHLGPCTLAETITASSRWPDQNWGLPIAFSLWGQLVGWSEIAIRALPWLTGSLTLAWVYRLGRDLFTPAIALTAALLLSTSVLFLSYMHIARMYVPSMLFTTITLWGYWRVTLAARPPDRAALVALLTGAAGLLYSLYLSALLVPAIGLFHLFLVRRDRRWWRATLLFGIAALLALPQVPDLLGGIAHNQGKEGLHSKALQAQEVLPLFLRYLSNDILNIPRPVSGLLFLALALPFLKAALTWRRRRRRRDASSYLAWTSLLLGLLVLTVNQWLQVLAPGRVRYLASLWPPTLLLFSSVIHRLFRDYSGYVAIVPVALIAISGILNFLQEGELIRHSWEGRKNPVSVGVAHRIAAEVWSDSTLLVDPFAFRYENRSYELYTGAWGDRRVPLHRDHPAMATIEQARERENVWLLFRTASADALHVPEIVGHLGQAGWSRVLDWQDGEVTLLHLRSPLRLSENRHARLEFISPIRFAGSWSSLQDGRLLIRVDLQSADQDLLSHYSLALHVIDPRTGLRVAQDDVGVGPGTYVPVRSDIDVSALPPGDYELHVALYDWQTGDRLIARDLQTGAVSDMHVLQRFRIG